MSLSMTKLFADAPQRHHEESEDEEEDDWTEDEDVHTPLDPIDPFVAFADTLGSLRQHLPARFEVRGALTWSWGRGVR